MHRKDVIDMNSEALQQNHQRLSRQSMLNYLGKADGAAERHRYSNVVTHPEVDGVDAAAHVDLVVQAFTLIHTEEGDN